MKPIVTFLAAGTFIATLAIAQAPMPRYTVIDLGTLPGGTFSQATVLNNNGLVTGVSTVHDGIQHPFIWYQGRMLDIGGPGLGGPNSAAFGVNARGQVGGLAESLSPDPNNENFCFYGTGLKCLPFVWQNGVMTALPTLGGNNAVGGPIDMRGEMIGIAENGIRDPECPPGVSVGGPGPQVLDFQAVVWGPKGDIRELRHLPGDSVGMGFWINDKGEAVGASGSCANTILPPIAASRHAVLWEKDGSPVDLGNLGGAGNPALLGVGNVAFAINNKTQVVGGSALSGNTVSHPFLWTRQTGMQDLGTLPGDLNTVALGINDQGEVVGPSLDPDGNLRAFFWKNGVMSDLNSLVADNSPLFLLLPSTINSSGQIAGFGVQKTAPYEVHAFLATPQQGPAANETFPHTAVDATRGVALSALPEEIRLLLRRRLPFGRFGMQLTGPR